MCRKRLSPRIKKFIDWCVIVNYFGAKKRGSKSVVRQISSSWMCDQPHVILIPAGDKVGLSWMNTSLIKNAGRWTEAQGIGPFVSV
jgi:hypothetical protein